MSKKVLSTFGKDQALRLALHWERDLIQTSWDTLFKKPLTIKIPSITKTTNRTISFCPKKNYDLICNLIVYKLVSGKEQQLLSIGQFMPWKVEKRKIQDKIKKLSSPSQVIKKIWERRAIRWNFLDNKVKKREKFFGPFSPTTDSFAWLIKHNFLDYLTFCPNYDHDTADRKEIESSFNKFFPNIRTARKQILDCINNTDNIRLLKNTRNFIKRKDPILAFVIDYKIHLEKTNSRFLDEPISINF